MSAPTIALLELDAIDDNRLLEPLSPEERTRAGAFRFASDGRRFALRRGWLRHLLATQASVEARTLNFAVGEHGKPFLPAFPDLHFSLSHSADIALAVIADVPVGCDIEACDPAKADPLIAARLLTPAEQAMLAPLAGEAWTAAFFDIWVRKEAYVKAIGTGLSTPVADMCVTDIPGWRLDGLAAPAGFAAAVARPA